MNRKISSNVLKIVIVIAVLSLATSCKKKVQEPDIYIAPTTEVEDANTDSSSNGDNSDSDETLTDDVPNEGFSDSDEITADDIVED